MKGSLFNYMDSQFELRSIYRIKGEEDATSSYSARLHIKAAYRMGEQNYLFTINRSDVLLNGSSPRKPIDKAIKEIGDALYPVVLEVSTQLEIQNIINFPGIKKRWEDATQRIQEYYNLPSLETYVQRAQKNLTDIKSLTAALYKDSFFNIYFRNIFLPLSEEERQLIRWYNFPEREMNLSYLYRPVPSKGYDICLSGEIMKIIPEHAGTYEMNYILGNKNEIRNISGYIEAMYKDKKYTKTITVNPEYIRIDHS